MAASLFAGAAGLGFHAIAARTLDADGYSGLAALLTILLISGLGISSLEVSVAEEVARAGSGERSLSRLLHRTGYVSIVIVMFGVWVSPLVGSYLQLPVVTPVVLAAVHVGLSALVAVLRGGLLGSLQLSPAGGGLFLLGMAKLAGGAAAAWAGADLVGVMAVLVVAEAVHLLRLTAAASRHGLLKGDPATIRLRGLLAPAGVVVGLWVLGTGDVVVARAVFGAGAGWYVAAATGAHLLLFIPQIAVQVTFPRFVRLQGDALRRAFRTAALAVAAAAGSAGLVLVLMPEVALSVLFGRNFVDAAPLLQQLVPASLAVSLAYIAVYRYLAKRRPAAFLPWVGVIGLGVLALHPPQDPAALAELVVALSIAVAVFALLPLARRSPATTLPERLPLRPSSGEVEVSVVIPFVHEGERLAATVGSLLAELEEVGADGIEVILVADGAPEASTSVACGLAAADPRIRFHPLPNNSGKGEAIRQGMRLAAGNWIGILDADGDIHPSSIGRQLELARHHCPDGVVGSKRHPESSIEYPAIRRLLSRFYNLGCRLLLATALTDTQAGAKLFSRPLVHSVLPLTRERGFVFDLELLAQASRRGFGRLLEAPIDVRHSGSSTVTLTSAATAAAAMFRIAVRLHLQQPPPPGLTQPTSSSPLPAASRS